MARITLKKGLESIQMDADTVEEAVNSALGQALGIPENPEYLVDGVSVDKDYDLEAGDVVTVQQKASRKA